MHFESCIMKVLYCALSDKVFKPSHFISNWKICSPRKLASFQSCYEAVRARPLIGRGRGSIGGPNIVEIRPCKLVQIHMNKS